MVEPPSYDGRGLVNLVAELERRLTGSAPLPGLASELAGAIPEAPTYVLVLFDGLGSHQLDHPAAGPFRESTAGVLDAPFATTTTVSLATLATGLSPAGHGVLGHLLWLPEVRSIVNTLKWITQWGEHVEYETASLLPAPNLWERLRSAGLEPITVQTGNFEGTALSRALYRGCRFESIWSEGELVEATADLARVPGRLILAYLPHVDFAAHVWGQRSGEYDDAMRTVATAWERLLLDLPPGAVAVGTADHGHIDYSSDDKLLVRDRRFDRLRLAGDPRSVMVWGPEDLIDDLSETTGAQKVQGQAMRDLYGPGPDHPRLRRRLPDSVLLAPPGRLILPRGFDKRLTGYHGGLEPAEREIPLLVGSG